MMEIIVKRLSSLTLLSPQSVAALHSLNRIRHVKAGADLLLEHTRPHPGFLLSGWAARMRWMPDGRRQIISFVLPGDGVGFCERPQPLALAPIVALTPLEVVEAHAVATLAYGPGAPDLKSALHISAAMEEAALIDQVVRLGRQTALERMANLLLELRFRLNLVGGVGDDAFDLPVTQEHLADALGLSGVHVNRTLQTLRADGLIELRRNRLRLLRPVLLEAIANYRSPEVTQWAGAGSHLLR